MTKFKGLLGDVINILSGPHSGQLKKAYQRGENKGQARVKSISSGWVVTLPNPLPNIWKGMLESQDSQPEFTYLIKWTDLVRLYPEQRRTALSSELSILLNVPDCSSLVIDTVDENDTELDTDYLGDERAEGEGLSNLPSDIMGEWNNLASWLCNYLPDLDSVGSIRVELSIKGQSLDVTRKVHQNGLNIDDTAERGWITPVKALNNVAVPLWLWQLDQGLNKIRLLLQSDDTRQQAFGLLQQLQEHVRANTPEHDLVIDAVQLDGIRYISISHWGVAVRPSLVGSTADVVPYSEELTSLLGLNEEYLIASIQEAMSNWDGSPFLTLRDCNNNSIIHALVMLTPEQQEAFLSLKKALYRRPVREIKNFIYFPDDTVHNASFQRVFQLDLSDFGPRVIGLGPIVYTSNPFGVVAGKSLMDRMAVDELYNPETGEAKIDKGGVTKPQVVPSPDGSGMVIKLYPPNTINDEVSNPIHTDIEIAKNFVEHIELALDEGHNLRDFCEEDLTLRDIEGNHFVLPPVESVLRPLIRDLKRAINQPIKSDWDTTVAQTDEPSETNQSLITEIEYDERYGEELSDKIQWNNHQISEWLKDVPNLKSTIELYEYQKEGVRWLLHTFMRRVPGVLFADDMGLGKTLQSLCFLSVLINRAWKLVLPEGYDPNAFDNPNHTINPILVVVPPVLIQNFYDQANDFFNNADTQFKMLLLHNDCGIPARSLYKNGLSPENIKGKETDNGVFRIPSTVFQDYRIVVTTYDCIEAHQISFARVKWSVMLCDEVQKAKNIRSKVSHALKAIASNTAFDIMMTGTPVENDMSELFNIMDIAYPGLLGKSPKEFSEKFGVLLGREPRSEMDTPQKAMEMLKGEDFLRFGDIQRGYMLGRLKTDVGKGLPNLYDDTTIATEISKEEYQGVKDESSHPLKLLQNLKLYGLHPQYRESQPRPGYELEWVKESPRFRKVLKKLEQIRERGEKALLFCEYHMMQESLQAAINKYFSLPEEFKAINSRLRRKKSVIDTFKSHEGFCALVLSPKCAGMGLNLQEANHVFHVSRWWNPAIEDQATCRAYRTGQTKDVYVYYCLSVLSDGNEGEMTFDQALHELLAEKRKKRTDLLSIDYATNISEYDLALKMGEPINWCIEQIDELGKGEIKGQSFEAWVKEQFEKEGFHTEKPQPDKGIDLIVQPKGGGDWIGIQVKHSHNPNAKSDHEKVMRFTSDLLNTGYVKRGLYFTNQTMVPSHREYLINYEEKHGQLSTGVISRPELIQYLQKAKTLAQFVEAL